jgi:hypothetical protein
MFMVKNRKIKNVNRNVILLTYPTLGSIIGDSQGKYLKIDPYA